MTLARLTGILCATVIGAGIAYAADDAQTTSRPLSDSPTASDVMNADAGVLAGSIPVDTPVQVSNTTVVCTGIGEEMENKPEWSAYPLRLEFAAATGHWVAEEQVTVSQDGDTVASFKCMGPVVLMDLPAGTYQISADVPEGAQKNLTVSVPASGQKVAAVQFNDVHLAQATSNGRDADLAYQGGGGETTATTPAPTETAQPEATPEEEQTEEGGAY